MKFKTILLMTTMISSHLTAQTDTYTIKLVTRTEMEALVPFIIQQRLESFRGYPYLYEGVAEIDRENEYATWLAKLPQSVLAVAYHDQTPIGFCSGTSFVDFDEHFKGSIDIFKNGGLKPERYYYIPEIIVVAEHRRKGVGEKLFQVLEEHARVLGYTALCLVEESHESHPFKPADYEPLDQLLLSKGYIKTPLVIMFDWQTIQPDGSVKNQDHRLEYWTKDLV